MMRLHLPQELAATFLDGVNAGFIGVFPPDGVAIVQNDARTMRIKTWTTRGLCSRGVLSYNFPMKIIQHPESFEVQSDDGSIVQQFPFDDNASRRAITGKMTKKQAFTAARTFAGKGHTIIPSSK